VQVIDFADPASPTTVDEVSLGEGKSPSAGAFDDAGTLWVSAWLTDEVIPVDFSGARGVAEAPVALDTTGVEGTPYPSGVAVVGGTVYVALNNLGADWSPAGNGRLATFEPASGEKGLIDLGATCTNPGFTAVAGTEIYVACTNSYFEGEVVVFDTATNEVTRRVATAGGPSRISIDSTRPGFFYVSDGASRGFFAVDDQDAFTKVDVCPAADFEFNSDVLVVP
jgi:YVTN family beta-propeller protein